MRAKKNVDSVKLEFRNAVLTEARMANYLRSRQKKGAELKGEIMLAVSAFYSVYAIAEDPNSTEIEIERAFVNSLNMLSGQMSELDVYCRGRFNLSATTWARFGELPSNVSSTFPTGSIASSPSAAKIPQAIDPALPVEIAWGDIDPTDFSDEEYEAHYAKMPRMNPITLPTD
jgi:hypothetical protein